MERSANTPPEINPNLDGLFRLLDPSKDSGRGKFLDSDNGDCSAVVVEYDEQKERAIAEAIFDWWISKKSFNQWFAETYRQGTLDLFDE